jgi:hypothetical protein
MYLVEFNVKQTFPCYAKAGEGFCCEYLLDPSLATEFSSKKSANDFIHNLQLSTFINSYKIVDRKRAVETFNKKLQNGLKLDI